MKSKIISYLLGLGMVFTSISCSDYVNDVNIDPNNATDAPTNTLITAAQVNLMGLLEGEDARLGTMWAQQFTGSDRQYTSMNNYLVTSETFDWGTSYIGIIQPCINATEKLEGTGNDKTIAMLKIMKAWVFGYLAAGWGDVPFTQANQGPEIANPEYDGQLAVYSGVQAMLDEGIAALEISGGNAILNDLLGNKSATRWIEVANTLKARFYLHVGDYSNAITAAGKGLSTSANDIMATHGTTLGGNENLWYDFHENQRSGYLTAKDALLPRLLDAGQSVYRGNAKTDETERFNFLYTGTAPGNYDLNVSDGMFKVNAPFPLITHIENELILAESELRKSAPDENAALAALNSARAALAAQFTSGTYDAYVITDFDNGGIANATGLTRQAALMAEIIEEKYVSLVGQVEVFNDLRRTKNAMGLTPTSGSQLPARFLIPTDEVNSNSNAPDPIPGLFVPTPANN